MIHTFAPDTALQLATPLGGDLVVWVAVALTLLAVVGSLVPMLPGGLLSLAGVYLYWWHTGYSDPGLVMLVVPTLLAVLVIAVDWLGGAISAKVSGASNSTTVLAGVAGFVLFFVAGPIGILLGIAGVVFLAEYRRTGTRDTSLRTAVYTTIGMLASNLAQALLTGLIFLLFLLVVVF
jgi:uncharacterized protein YqgC (DUF456 family)